MPKWTQGFIRSIEPTSPKNTIEKGDKLKVVLQGASFSPIVLVCLRVLRHCHAALTLYFQENSPHEFKWRGSLLGIFVGDHSFRFEPSKTTPGSTTFVHSEEFHGALVTLLKIFPQGTKQKDGFDGFNRDLKRRVESQR